MGPRIQVVVYVLPERIRVQNTGKNLVLTQKQPSYLELRL